MRVFVVSDVHVDYPQNKRWLFELSRIDYQQDVLILAGDVTDNLALLEQCFSYLKRIFLTVMYVPGNHELWLREGAFSCSLKKFEAVSALAAKYEMAIQTRRFDTLSIIPLYSWYDFSFDEPRDNIRDVWADFYHCKWPEGYELSDVTAHFLAMNKNALSEENETMISFSHFLPSLDVMPEGIPEQYRFLNAVLGSKLLGEQVEQLRPDIHVYGHSHLNRDISLNGIRYINNAYGYPHEGWTREGLLCVYEGD